MTEHLLCAAPPPANPPTVIRPVRPPPHVSQEPVRTDGLGLFARLTDQRIIMAHFDSVPCLFSFISILIHFFNEFFECASLQSKNEVDEPDTV